MKEFIGMGDYYHNKHTGTLVKVVCRANDTATPNSDIICYSVISKGGICSELHYMPIEDFVNTFK